MHNLNLFCHIQHRYHDTTCIIDNMAFTVVTTELWNNMPQLVTFIALQLCIRRLKSHLCTVSVLDILITYNPCSVLLVIPGAELSVIYLPTSTSLQSCCVHKGASTPLKKRRLTADAMSAGCASMLAQDVRMVDKHTTWPSVHEQFESRPRLLASRNLFEVRFYIFTWLWRGTNFGCKGL